MKDDTFISKEGIHYFGIKNKDNSYNLYDQDENNLYLLKTITPQNKYQIEKMLKEADDAYYETQRYLDGTRFELVSIDVLSENSNSVKISLNFNGIPNEIKSCDFIVNPNPNFTYSMFDLIELIPDLESKAEDLLNKYDTELALEKEYLANLNHDYETNKFIY